MTATQLRSHVLGIRPIVEEIERLAPALAGVNSPNAEYPWQPAPGAFVAPASHDFTPLIVELGTERGRKFLTLTRAALFDEAWHRSFGLKSS